MYQISQAAHLPAPPVPHPSSTVSAASHRHPHASHTSATRAPSSPPPLVPHTSALRMSRCAPAPAAPRPLQPPRAPQPAHASRG